MTKDGATLTGSVTLGKDGRPNENEVTIMEETQQGEPTPRAEK